jgi:hypothetical protein
MSLEIKNLLCGYDGRPVCEPINLVVRPGEILCVLGPNGVGKTTFFKTVLGFLPPLGGQVLWRGAGINQGGFKERARLIAYVPQTQTAPFPYRVREVVAMGRVAHLPAFRNPGPADYQRVRPLTSESAIGTIMKGRTALPQGDLCDYPYNRYEGSISPRKFSHGSRPVTRYETMGPGPVYDKQPAIERRPISIGVKFRARADHFPGPADYFKTPITPKPLPPCGFYGPTDRCPVDLKKVAKEPGPADYEGDPVGRPRTGFYFTSRMMDDFVPDTAGTYVGQVSGLAGPKWTIGTKNA